MFLFSTFHFKMLLVSAQTRGRITQPSSHSHYTIMEITILSRAIVGRFHKTHTPDNAAPRSWFVILTAVHVHNKMQARCKNKHFRLPALRLVAKFCV